MGSARRFDGIPLCCELVCVAITLGNAGRPVTVGISFSLQTQVDSAAEGLRSVAAATSGSSSRRAAAEFGADHDFSAPKPIARTGKVRVVMGCSLVAIDAQQQSRQLTEHAVDDDFAQDSSWSRVKASSTLEHDSAELASLVSAASDAPPPDSSDQIPWFRTQCEVRSFRLCLVLSCVTMHDIRRCMLAL